MTDIDEIVEKEIVLKIDTSIKVKTASALNGTLQTITFCNQKYLRLFQVLVNKTTDVGYAIQSNDGHSVVVMVNDPSEEIKKGDILNMPLPFYHRGTPRALNSVWTLLSNDERNKLPAIWLLNPIDEAWKNENDIERTADLMLFIMCESSHDELTKDLRQKHVFPMLQLAKEIERAIASNPLWFNRLNGYKTRDYSVFGTEDKNGMIKNIIDSELSGLSMAFSLEILKGNCNC